MKRITLTKRSFLISLLSLFISLNALSQDADPAITGFDLESPVTTLGSTNILRIIVGNFGGPTTIKPNSLRLVVSAGKTSEIIGIHSSDTSNAWVMSTTTPSEIDRNGTANIKHFTNVAEFGDGDVRELRIEVLSKRVGAGDSTVIDAQIVYIADANPLVDACGFPPNCNSASQGDDPGGVNNMADVQFVVTSLLPLRLLSFNGLSNGCNVNLNWKTSDEVNTDYFQVEESEDGNSFTVIGKVKSQGTGPGKDYSYAAGEKSQKKFYRLKIVDIDGSFSYSPVRSVKLLCVPVASISLYPNPLSGTQSLTLRFIGTHTGSAKVCVTSVTGQSLMTTIVNMRNGSNIIPLNVAALPQGTYDIQLQDAKGNRLAPTQTFIKQ